VLYICIDGDVKLLLTCMLAIISPFHLSRFGFPFPPSPSPFQDKKNMHAVVSPLPNPNVRRIQ
jgi:hypothetical protein